jgi:ADP-ribosylglycohydrolase
MAANASRAEGAQATGFPRTVTLSARMGSLPAVTDGPFPRQKVLGSILAGAVGDALGAAARPGRITDSTQLTLFTMEGLIRSHMALRRHIRKRDPLEAVQHAYQRWYHTQGVPWHEAGGDYALDEAPDGWLIGNRELFRPASAPGDTVLDAVRSYAQGGKRGSLSYAINDARDCGAVKRVAPVALWTDDGEEVFVFGAATASLTHGHADAILPAGALAELVHLLLTGADLPDALAETRAELRHWEEHDELLVALDAAEALAGRERPTPRTIAAELGTGRSAVAVLANAVCVALTAESLEDGTRLATSLAGNTAATGSICGNLLGAMHGVDAIPAGWLAELELREIIERLTLDALAEFGEDPPTGPDWLARYPAW